MKHSNGPYRLEYGLDELVVHKDSGTLTNESHLEDIFWEDLDEQYKEVEICGLTYPASHALRHINEDHHRKLFFEWLKENGYTRLYLDEETVRNWENMAYEERKKNWCIKRKGGK